MGIGVSSVASLTFITQKLPSRLLFQFTLSKGCCCVFNFVQHFGQSKTPILVLCSRTTVITLLSGRRSLLFALQQPEHDGARIFVGFR